MAKYDIRQRNPARYAAASTRQAELRHRYAGLLTKEVLCDYCDHPIGIYVKGTHGPTELKCQKCGEITIVEPISFRLAV